MLSGKRILVVEREFRVALDIQRVLEDARNAKTVFARSVEEAALLADRFADYDLAVVEMTSDSGDGAQLATSLLAAGVAVVATSTDAAFGSEAARRLGLPFVGKPFEDEALLSACLSALASRPDKGR